jgi:hypothetical protein
MMVEKRVSVMSNTTEQVEAEYIKAWTVCEETLSAFEKAQATNPNVIPLGVFVAYKKAREACEAALEAYKVAL